MGRQITKVHTVKCDGVGCDKQVTFPEQNAQQIINDNPWFRSIRVVITGDNRNLLYCSDVCEVSGLTAGTHVIPEQPLVVEGNEAAVLEAAARAQAQRQNTETLQSGRGGNIVI